MDGDFVSISFAFLFNLVNSCRTLSFGKAMLLGRLKIPIWVLFIFFLPKSLNEAIKNYQKNIRTGFLPGNRLIWLPGEARGHSMEPKS